MNEQDIFLAALDITDSTQRADYLNRTCAGDPTLRRQVEALLAAHERSGEFLDVPALQQMAAGASEDWSSLAKTSAEHRDAKGEIDLSFLQPTTKPNSLGRLGHYEVQEVIGRGGCGIVLKAFDEMLYRAVAIKVMAPELASTSPARKRFLREARAAAAIRHENVVSIHSVEDQPIPFLVMEYIAGQTLQQKLDQTGPLDVLAVVQIGHQIASGLEAAHAMGLIHRDIKPGNVLLEKGRDRVKITDFGLARATDDASLTQSGVIAGTPLYMSPEQAMGDEIDQRSDLFSLGSVLYVMCSGRPPFRAATTLAVLKRVAEDQPRPIQEIIPEVPEWLRAFIAKLHAKNPDDRFASAQEVAGLLARCLSELQQHGNVESLAHVLPMLPKPASATKGPAQREPPKSEERPAPALDSRPPLPRSRRWVVAAAMLMVLLAGLGLTEATGVTNVRGTVVRLFSPNGTLVVEVDDPGVSVSIDGEEMVITGTGAKEIRLKPGQYKVLASKDDKLVRQELVTVTKNGRQVLRVSKELDPGRATGVGQSIGGAIAPKMAQFVRGNWHIVGDVIEHPEKKQSALLLFGSPEFGDGDFSCEAMRAEGDHGLALVARASDLKNYYYFDIGVFNNSYHSIYSKEAGTNWRRLDQQKAPPVPTDRWVKMRLHLHGDSFEGYLDDQLVVSGRDDRRLKGYLGLRTWNEAGKYRNLKFTDPTGKVLWQGLPDISTLKRDVSLSARFTNSLGMEFALVPKGKSWLGGGNGVPGKKQVEFKDDFYLGVYEVTQEEWEKVTGQSPSHFSRTGSGKDVVKDIPDAELNRFPVEMVSWDDAQLFLERLNKREKEAGWVYRLPIAAEWEYACRGGPLSDKMDSAYDFYFDKPTNHLLPEQANSNNVLDRTCKVGLYMPNRLGLYDMHGNVWEWCDDAEKTVDRGGCWSNALSRTTPSPARLHAPSNRGNYLGLRVARVRIGSSTPPVFAAAPFDEVQAKVHQEAWAAHLGRKVVEENSLGMKLTLIPPGKFLMGSPDSDPEVKGFEKPQHAVELTGGQRVSRLGQPGFEKPQHAVELTGPYVIAAHEVTQEQFQKILSRNPSAFSAQGRKANEATGLETGKLPVEMVSWYDAIEFCNKLSEQVGKQPYYELSFEVRDKDGNISMADVKELGGTGYRLPSEAEWEHACRAGTESPYSFEFKFSTFRQYGWFGYDNGRPHGVGERKPNAFGLFDMHGNVFEFCSDWLGDYPASAVQDPRGPSSGSDRLVRGGCWNFLVQYSRSAFREGQKPGSRYELTGFRVVHSVPMAHATTVATDPDRRAAEWVLSIGGGIGITDNGQVRPIVAVGDLPKGAFELTGVELNFNPKVSDAGLVHIKDCKNLSNLVLSGTKVTDTGVAHVKDAANLTRLLLDNTAVSDNGIEVLGSFKSLRELKLKGTKMTEAGVKKLSTALPQCKIEWDGGVIEPKGTAPLPGGQAGTRSNDYDKLATGRWIPVLAGPGKSIEPRNAVFSNGLIEISNGHAYDKSSQAADVIVRTKVQKLAGQIVLLTLRDVLGVYYSAVYQNDGVERFGVGTRDTRFRTSVKQHFEAAADVKEGEFFELAFAAVGDTLTVYANGKRVGEIRDSAITQSGGVAVHATKGKGVFKDVEVMVLDKPAP